ncbi:YegP family protein [Algiphilus sp. W345]|uniref:YegP family protein n=1 Tax=Banduia mediterranea TaxID=3075609 RepID=A0ABU2WPB7_9GAMM|nr:YegP family protein [Algiphilus sp. W345]MDT0499186.1 YegP family protein [Algiphilus sp. W345]
MGGYYKLFQSSRNAEWYFSLKAGNHETILQSEGYKAKAGSENGIASVQVNSPNDARYERKESSNGYWFTLKAANGEPIGRSEMYTTASARDKGIESVKTNGPSRDVRED